MENIGYIANSYVLFAICLVPIAISVVQAGLFLVKGLKQAKVIGLDSKVTKKIIGNTAAFSVLPSLPILITLVTLTPLLGRFIPWLRLSVIGNAVYEAMAADMAIKAYGLAGLGDPNITPAAFGSVVWAMTLGIMASPILTTFFLKSYDKGIKKAQSGKGFLPLAIGAMFTGMLSLMAVPRMVNFADMQGVLTLLTAGAVAILLIVLSKVLKKKILSDFSFPAAMLVGMMSAILWNNLFPPTV